MCQKGAMALTPPGALLGTQTDLGIDNLDPATGPVRGPEAQRHLPAGAPDCREERESEGQVRRGRYREGAARPVQLLPVSTATQPDHVAAVVEHVDQRTFQMAAFHEDRARAQASDC